MKRKPGPGRWIAVVAIVAATLAAAACTSVGIGIGFPIGRMGGITIGGAIPIPPREPAASAPAPSASAPASAPVSR